MSDGFLTFLISFVIIAAAVVPYVLLVRGRERRAREKMAQLGLDEQKMGGALHPHIDALVCIGCGACVTACPEGDVLAVIDGKASLVDSAQCVGHGLCADACPVGGITLLMGAPGKGANLPVLSQTFETTVPGIFIAGELSGMGLIKNAVMQGTAVGKEIARRVHSEGPRQSNASLDVAVIGAGPAGLAVALSAMGDGLRYVVLEQGDAGGTILHYPRRKIVMTAPVELPVWGPLKFRETTKENLLAVWKEIVQKTGLEVHNREKVTGVTKEGEFYRVVTDKGTYAARYIVLALGRRGTPRTLGVPGEDLPKVMYQLIDASTYRDTHVLVVGGGDSAVEAAVGLAVQKSNNVTLSYRKPEFTRIKARNEEHMRYYQKKGIIRVVMSSTVGEIREREVILRTPEGMEQLHNDVVFVFAGGELPFEFLKNVGIEFQQQAVA